MKTKFFYITIAALIISLVFSCTKDIIETDLKNKIVTLDAPADKYSTTTQTQLFWWEPVDGALKYNLQIVEPSFSFVQQLMLDTNVAATKYSFTLPSGTYQWRVRAFNGSSNTAYTVRTITIDSISSLANQTIVLASPANNSFFNTYTQTFRWQKLQNTTDYEFQIINQTNSSNVISITQTDTSYSYTFLAEGQYTWQVRGQNVTSNTLYSSNTITIDVTPPVVSTPSSPANATTVVNPVDLKWYRDASSIGDSLFIATDSTFKTPIYYSGYFIVLTYNFTAGTSGQNYYWRLRSKDAAGNLSAYSSFWRFTVQ